MPFHVFGRNKKAAPLDYTHLATPAELYNAPLDLIPVECTHRRPGAQLIYRDAAKHVSMAAEVLVWEEQSAFLAGGDEDCSSLATAASPARPARITTTDSWLAGEYPSLYTNNQEESVEEESVEEPVSPMSSTETLVEVEIVVPAPKTAHIAAKIEAIAAEVPRKPSAVRSPTLIPLAVAQARTDIKYRPEGFEMLESLQGRRGGKVWWKAC